MDELIQRLAATSAVTPGEAADEIEKLIHKIVKRLRHGQDARLPGLGHFTPGLPPGFQPEKGKDEGSRSLRRPGKRS